MSGIKPTPNSNLFPNFEEAQPLIDDSRMNETIKNLLKTFPDACWGGSSVLYDIVLPFMPPPNKLWDTRDFDVYCFDKDYNKIISFLKTFPMVSLCRIFPTMRKLSYANLDIKGLTEYLIKLKDGITRKIQLVNIGNQSNYSNLYKAVDLSFCSVVVSNNMVYYLRTSKIDVLEKRGKLLTFPCMCSSCSKNDGIRLNYKISNRIKKYRARGFKIDMICQFCDYSINTIQHTQLCLCRTVVSNKKINSLDSILNGFDESKLGIDEINRLISYSHQYKNDSVVLLSIYLIFCYFKRIDLLYSFWEEIKSFMDIRVVMECSKQLVKSGLYTGFRLLFEYLFPHNINIVNSNEREQYIYSIMETVVNSNYIQSALLIQSRIPTIKLSIYEDKIFSWKNRVVYEMLFKLINAEDSSQDEIDSLMKTIPFVEKLEANDPAIQTICPTCRYDDCSTKMICGHYFCQYCLIFNLMDIYEKSKKEMCPCCRTEYHYLTKRVCNA